MFKDTSSTADANSHSRTKHRPGSKGGRSKTNERNARSSKTEIGKFLRQMFADRPVSYQVYPSKGKTPAGRPLSNCAPITSELIRSLADISDKGLNVAVVPNEMDGNGRKAGNCVGIRFAFADFDKGEHTRESLMNLPVKPTCIVETSPGKVHVYWRVEGCTVEQFSAVQKAIAAKLGSDPAVFDPSRCLRLPGSLNHKYDPPYRAHVVFPAKGERRGHRVKIDKFIAKMRLDLHGSKANAKSSGKVDDGTLTDKQILELLSQIDASSYETWRMVGQALCSRYPTKHGRRIWDRWSARCTSKYDIARQRKEWATFTADGGITIGTLVHLVRAGQQLGEVPTDELELAEALAIHGADKIRFGKTGQTWWLFDDVVWVETKNAHGAMKYARSLLLTLCEQAGGSPEARRLLRASVLRGAVNMAQLDPRLEIDEALFDADPLLLGVTNGVVDLRKSEFRQAAPTDYLTKQSNVTFDAAAKCPTFDKTLKQVCKDRKDLGQFILRVMGYTLTGLASEEKLFLLIGRAGNGKGTLMNLLKDILGGYAVAVAPNLLTKAYKGNPNSASSAIMRLRGARMILCTELLQDKLDETFIKQLSGGDALAGRSNYADQTEFKPVGKVWLSTNDDPEISMGADAMWRRIVVLPFDASFDGTSMDTTLKERLAAEAAGVLNLMVKSAREYLEARDEREDAEGKMPTGLRDSKTVQLATSGLRLRSDTVLGWLTECCEKKEDGCLQSSVAYKSYSSFAKSNGKKPLGLPAFGKALVDKGLPRKKGRGFNGFLGFRMIERAGRT